jgi:hemerythrin superfamily protein
MDILEHLTAEHRKAEALIAKLAESEEGAVREEAVQELTQALTTHMAVEEQFLYPIVADVLGRELTTEAENEHGLARDALDKMGEMMAEPGFGAAVAMLQGAIGHHVEDEEGEMFPKLREQAADRIANLDPAQCEQQVTTSNDLVEASGSDRV